MAIEVSCSGCGRNYRMKDDRAGSKVRCKDCQTIIEVPEADFDQEWDEQESPWETAAEPAPLPSRRRSAAAGRTTAGKSTASNGTSTVMKVLGILAFVIAAAMTVGIVISVIDGNFRTLRGAWLPFVFCGVGYKWIFGSKE